MPIAEIKRKTNHYIMNIRGIYNMSDSMMSSLYNVRKLVPSLIRERRKRVQTFFSLNLIESE